MAVKKTTSTKSPQTKGRPSKSSKSTPAASTGDKELTVDRRRTARRVESPSPAPAKLERRTKVQRRRQIDPTTCERDYSDDEIAFMNAIDEYKRTSGRMFPTCSEVLEVIRGLGYVQLTPAELAIIRPSSPDADGSAADNVAAGDDRESEAL